MSQSIYKSSLKWTPDGTTTEEKNYSRFYDLSQKDGVIIKGGPGPYFGESWQVWNPEDLLTSALMSCHQLTYLFWANVKGLKVLEYADNGEAHLSNEGGLHISKIVINPTVTIAADADAKLAIELHNTAKKYCLVANAIKAEKFINPTVIKK